MKRRAFRLRSFRSRLYSCSVLVLLVGMFVGISAGPAFAAIALKYDPPSGPPGTLIRAETVGPAMSLIPSRKLKVFLAPESIADRIRSQNDKRLVGIGDLLADEKDVGRMEFVVPPLPVGTYVALAWCRECGSGNGPITIGPPLFKITDGKQGKQPSQGTDPVGLVLIVALTLVGVAIATRALLTARFRRRRV